MRHPVKTVLSLTLALTLVGTAAYAAGVAAERANSKVTVDGKTVALEGYQIDGHNYFKLRDVAEAVGFGVTWNNATGTVEIDTERGYTPEASAAAKPAQGVAETIAAFQNLNVEIGVGDVFVKTGEAYTVSLESHGTDKYGTPYELHYSNEGGKLSIWSTPRQLSTDNGQSPTGKVVVTVPEGKSLSEAVMELGMGGLDWSGCGLTKKLDCDLGMGDAVVSGSLSGAVDLELGMGDATISGSVDGDIDLDLGMGDADLSGDFTGDIDVDNGMGDVSLTLDKPLSYYTYRLDVADYMGTIRLDGKKQTGSTCTGGTGSRALKLSSGMGDVSLSFGG